LFSCLFLVILNLSQIIIILVTYRIGYFKPRFGANIAVPVTMQLRGYVISICKASKVRTYINNFFCYKYCNNSVIFAATQTSLFIVEFNHNQPCCNHWTHLSHFNWLKALRKEIFMCFVDRTSTTITCLCCTMLCRKGYCSASEDLPNQISSKKTSKNGIAHRECPCTKEILLHMHHPFPKRRISGLSSYLWQRFLCTYLFLNNAGHTPSSLSNLFRHLLRKYFFFKYNTSMPSHLVL
jgi:hypothetical protein